MLFARTMLIALLLSGFCWAEDLNCLPKPVSFYAHLQQEAYQALDRRLEQYEALETPEQIRAYQTKLNEFFRRRIGEFPEKTPLNANTVKTIQADGYRIENVIFESRPHHHVTANFYLPEGKGPFPAVLVASGHSRTAKTADYNQRFAIMMAEHGMAALCFDPIGQGERSQILDDDGHNQFSGTTTEHFLVGVGSILVGRNTAHYEIWDGIRSIDYLVSRPEVDATKIGMTGCSGGGTQTSYLMALDDRIVCAAPSCYLTTFRRLIETIGPQDSEQNIFGQLRFGMDQPDYVIMRAPQPTLISSTTEDFFSIEGSWENLRQSKRIYGKLGFPEKVDLVESEGKHGVPPQNLATIGQWMQRWLLEKDESIPAVEIAHRPLEDLHCLPTGQVLTLPDEKSVQDLNRELETQLAEARKKLWESESKEALRARVRSRIGLGKEFKIEKPRGVIQETIEKEGYRIEKHVLESTCGVPIPALVFRPDKPASKITLLLSPSGKAAEAEAGKMLEKIAQRGEIAIAIDLPNQGETSDASRTDLHGDWKTYYLAYLLEKSLIGIWTQETLNAALYARSLSDSQNVELELIGQGEAGIVALHAAALKPDLFDILTLSKTPKSWSTVVGEPVPEIGLDYTVHGALTEYDLPNLTKLLRKTPEVK